VQREDEGFLMLDPLKPGTGRQEHPQIYLLEDGGGDAHAAVAIDRITEVPVELLGLGHVQDCEHLLMHHSITFTVESQARSPLVVIRATSLACVLHTTTHF
jgi:hypothetical protein